MFDHREWTTNKYIKPDNNDKNLFILTTCITIKPYNQLSTIKISPIKNVYIEKTPFSQRLPLITKVKHNANFPPKHNAHNALHINLSSFHLCHQPKVQ